MTLGTSINLQNIICTWLVVTLSCFEYSIGSHNITFNPSYFFWGGGAYFCPWLRAKMLKIKCTHLDSLSTSNLKLNVLRLNLQKMHYGLMKIDFHMACRKNCEFKVCNNLLVFLSMLDTLLHWFPSAWFLNKEIIDSFKNPLSYSNLLQWNKSWPLFHYFCLMIW